MFFSCEREYLPGVPEFCLRKKLSNPLIVNLVNLVYNTKLNFLPQLFCRRIWLCNFTLPPLHLELRICCANKTLWILEPNSGILYQSYFAPVNLTKVSFEELQKSGKTFLQLQDSTIYKTVEFSTDYRQRSKTILDLNPCLVAGLESERVIKSFAVRDTT